MKIRDGGYTASPWALCWDDENYYLIAYDTCADSIKHYRVDKMDDIEVLDDERDGERPLKNLILQIIQRAFSQCSEVKKLRLSCRLTMTA